MPMSTTATKSHNLGYIWLKHSIKYGLMRVIFSELIFRIVMIWYELIGPFIYNIIISYYELT